MDDVGMDQNVPPTLSAIAAQGKAVYDSLNPAYQAEIQNALTRVQNKWPNRGVGDWTQVVYHCIGLLKMVDSIKLAYTQAQDTESRRLMQVRLRLIRTTFPNFFDSQANPPVASLYRRIQKIFHLSKRRDRRAELARAGPYGPFENAYVLPHAPRKWKIRRGANVYDWDVLGPGAMWNRLPTRPPNIPAIQRPKWNDAQREIMRNAMRNVRAAAAAVPPPPPEGDMLG